MNFKGHLALSSICAAGAMICAPKVGIDITFQEMDYIVPAIIMGSWFPDCDTHSTSSKIYAAILFVLLIIFSLKRQPWYGIALISPFIAAKLSKHRGWMHKYYLPTGLLVAAYFLPKFLTFEPISSILIDYFFLVPAFCFGIVTHYFGDQIWPWQFKNWRF